MAAELASAYFGDPLPWQPHLLDAMLARDSRDKYLLRSIGISIPRQNGKSWDVRARCFYGALNGEKILYTCQHGDTSDQMFQELSRPFEDEDEPELNDLLLAVRKTNGQQAIKLKNGGLIRFTTRTDSLARGKTYDVLIYDEAQELTAKQQAASLPAISAGSKHNPQTIYLGTPPGPDNVGTVFRDLHEDVHSGRSEMGWIEWGATEIGDVHDEARWFEYNPSLGTVLDIEAVRGESEQMQPDVFARERLAGGLQSAAPTPTRFRAPSGRRARWRGRCRKQARVRREVLARRVARCRVMGEGRTRCRLVRRALRPHGRRGRHCRHIRHAAAQPRGDRVRLHRRKERSGRAEAAASGRQDAEVGDRHGQHRDSAGCRDDAGRRG
jgi:hypothetical protein